MCSGGPLNVRWIGTLHRYSRTRILRLAVESSNTSPSIDVTVDSDTTDRNGRERCDAVGDDLSESGDHH